MADLIYLSFGAGVQSSALLVMSALGLKGVPRAHAAVFADTRQEPPWVYEQVNLMREWVAPHGIPIHVVSAGDLGADLLARLRRESGSRSGMIPAWVNGKDGKEALLSRSCTEDYKRLAIEAKVRDLLGRKKGQRKGPTAAALIGISWDERDRMKTARKPWLVNCYPLVDLAISRLGCEEILTANGLPVPHKSACLFCPFHDDDYWRWLQDNHPNQWEEACLWDAKIRDMSGAGVESPAYLHRSRVPLPQVQLKPKGKTGERSLFDPHGFGNECEGMCGV